jgi:hypothetical protein
LSWTPVLVPTLGLDDVRRLDAVRDLVVVVGPDRDTVNRCAHALGGDGTRLVPADLIQGLCGLVVGWDMGTTELGPPTLLSSDSWLVAVRRLLLRLLTGNPGRTVLGCVGPVWQLMYLRRLLPDAAIVLAVSTGQDAEWDTRLDDVRVGTDLLLGDVPSQRVGRTDAEPVRAGSPTTGERSLVLVGSGRSGTTWLHNLLCAHHGVAGTPMGETSVFRLIEPLWRALGGTAAEPSAVDAQRCFVGEVLVDALDPTGRAIVCEKTPDHSWLIPLIRHLLPQVRLVHLVRDGRDVAMSLHALDGAYQDLPSAGRAWARLVSTVRRDLADASAWKLVRYEQLMDDPAQVIAALWDWLGVPTTTADLQRLDDRVHVQVTPLPSSRQPGTQRWHELPRKQRKALTAAIGPELENWRYLV